MRMEITWKAAVEVKPINGLDEFIIQQSESRGMLVDNSNVAR